MIKVVYFIRKRPDISLEAFKHHYETQHVPLSERAVPEMKQHARNYVLRGVGDHQPDYDCMTECWFEDWAALKRAGQSRSEEMQRLIAEDEERFMDRSFRRSVIFEENLTRFER